MTGEHNIAGCPEGSRISAYYDGESSEDESAELTLHVTRCRHCRAAVLELQAVSETISLGFTPSA